MVAFTAKGVAATEMPDLNTKAVILSEDADGGGLRLELQRALKYTKQDRALGQDTYCLVTHTGATVYGGVRSYTLEGASLTMRLEPIAYDTLGVPEEFTILLEADAATLERRSGYRTSGRRRGSTFGVARDLVAFNGGGDEALDARGRVQ